MQERSVGRMTMTITCALMMWTVCLVLCCGAILVGAERFSIDAFEYAENDEAQAAWVAMGNSRPVEVAPHETKTGKTALRLTCDFSRKQERSYWDKAVQLDLSRFGRFSITVYAEDPSAVGHCTLYFNSADGWYAGGFTVEGNGWQVVTLNKAQFRTEDDPIGWHDIRIIRLSIWKGKEVDTAILVDDLEAVFDDIVVVRGDLTIKKKSAEARAVEQFAERMAALLKRIGVEAGVINDTEVEANGLNGRKLAIFPHNPDMSEKEMEEIEKFVAKGGKLMLFYGLPSRLAKLLGVENVRWMREEYPGQFASIRFTPGIVDGMPESVKQQSWNITVARPVTEKARVIGEWYDAVGKATLLPALTLSDNGVFMAHVLLPGDETGKEQMMLALLGKLLPPVWELAAERAIVNAGRLPELDDFAQSCRFIDENAKDKPGEKEALKHLAEAKRIRAGAEEALAQKQFPRAASLAREMRQHLLEAYYLCQSSRQGEFRAVWCHSAYGVPGWKWERSIQALAANGFSAVVPNMLWAGVAHYPSEILPVADGVKEKGDQIAECLSACRKYGIQIHVWKVNWNLATAPKEFVEKMRQEGRMQKDRNGNDVEWLCPSHLENFKLELESMLEVARKYDVDGLHFDYIRYPHSNACYCLGCKERFEKSAGVTVTKWPNDVITGEHKAVFADWRREQITRLVRAVSEEARKLKPNIKISAAVFPEWPGCRDYVGQDWKAWVEKGYLDFVCPMDYTDSNNRFRQLVSNQVQVVNRLIPLYPGIGASAPGLPPEQVVAQVQIARQLGADGFIIFNYDAVVAEQHLPALHKGATVEGR